MQMSTGASVDPTMWSTLLYAGVAGSFMGLPYVAPREQALRSHGAKAGVYGLPFDSTTIGRSGANYGPRSIREQSYQFRTYNATFDFDLAETLNPVDSGDCEVVPANAELTFKRAQRDISEIIAAGALAVVFGGDHSITIPAVRAVKERCQDPGLILLDSHLDTATEMGGEQLNNCCPIARAIDAGFDPEKTVLIGMSGWLNPRSELEYCRERGITVIWLDQIWERGTAWAVQRARQITRAAADGVYLSIDIDCLDAAHASGTCCPTTSGLSSREAIELVRGVSRGGLIGFDVVEVAPQLEATPATSLMGIRLALEAMAFHAGAGS
jgi:guanidinobutyrase